MNQNNVSLNDLYKKSDEIISRHIAGEAILVPLRRNAADLDAIFALNETAALVWDSTDGIRSLRETLDRVILAYDVEESIAADDLCDLMAQFLRIGAVVKV